VDAEVEPAEVAGFGAEVAAEDAAEVARIGEAGGAGDLVDGQVGLLEEALMYWPRVWPATRLKTRPR